MIVIEYWDNLELKGAFVFRGLMHLKGRHVTYGLTGTANRSVVGWTITSRPTTNPSRPLLERIAWYIFSVKRFYKWRGWAHIVWLTIRVF